jgi:hypothetical protein
VFSLPSPVVDGCKHDVPFKSGGHTMTEVSAIYQGVTTSTAKDNSIT